MFYSYRRKCYYVFVDKSSIKRVEENEFIYKAQAVVYEVENINSRRTNS